MTNRLITLDQAAADLRQAILSAAEEATRDGIAPKEFAKGVELYFASLGCFPSAAVQARAKERKQPGKSE